VIVLKDVRIQVCRLQHGEGLGLPKYQTPGSAGMDLMAAVGKEVILEPLQRKAIPTGLSVAIPEGFEAQIRPRSGLALKQGLTVANAPGTIDSDYRGEIKVILVNMSQEPVSIKHGDRIAQFIVAPVVQGLWEPCEALPRSSRGSGGFGHTGK
jgi:dUTP pyrophosphatase